MQVCASGRTNHSKFSRDMVFCVCFGDFVSTNSLLITELPTVMVFPTMSLYKLENFYAKNASFCLEFYFLKNSLIE